MSSIMEASRGGHLLQPWHTTKPELTTKDICSNCNSGWMSDLETHTKPILGALITQKTVILNYDQQTLLATWCVKTAMVHETSRQCQPFFYTKPERIALKESLQLPCQTYVWLAKCVKHQGIFIVAKDLGGRIEESAKLVSGYVTTMGFGPIAIQILSIKIPLESESNSGIVLQQRSGEWNDTLLPIWPIRQEKICWPALMGLDSLLGLQYFSERWSPISQ
jgi:hypothetical protein